jgi:glutamyl-tRNA reductase
MLPQSRLMPSSRLSSLRAHSISHQTVGLGALPALSLGCDQAVALHGAMTTAGVPSVVLATCNRTEIYWQSRGAADDHTVRALVAQALGTPGMPVLSASDALAGHDAARHLLRVAAGLESVVVGEAEILGQVRAALDACPGAGALLTRVFHAAVRAGRMARTETAIGVGAQSVASAAVRMLADTIRLAEARVAVVGAGDTGSRTARHLRALGAGEIVVVNRTPSRGAALAAAAGGASVALEDLQAELARADAVVFAVAVTRPLVERAALERAVASRADRPLTVVDLSMPAAVEKAELAGLILLDFLAVERTVASDRARRAAEIPRVESVLARELALLERWAVRQVAPGGAGHRASTRLEAAG